MNGGTLERLIKAALGPHLFLGVYHDSDFVEPKEGKDYIAVLLRNDNHWVLRACFNQRCSIYDTAEQQKDDTCGAFVVIIALLLATTTRNTGYHNVDEELALCALEEWIKRIIE